MLIRIILLIFFLLNILPVNSHEPEKKYSSIGMNTIIGQITDEVTGEELAGVKVSIAGAGLEVYTNFEGNFVFDNVSPGEYILCAEYVSYQKRLIRRIKQGQNFIQIKLKNNSYLISPNINLTAGIS